MNINTVNKLLLDNTYIEQNKPYIKDYQYKLSILGVPESYSRERQAHGHWYNPKEKKMKEFRDLCKKALTIQQLDELYELRQKENQQIEIDVKYYLSIQKASTNKDAVLKELGIIKPIGRPDLDNYDKFLLDSFHNVFYSDDSFVVKINSEKLYSLTPRTDFTVSIHVFE